VVPLTISLRNEPQVQRFLKFIQIDNDGIVERKIAPKVRKLIPAVRREFRTHQLPSGLEDQEMKYLERVEWPKSRYFYKVLREASLEYRNVNDDILWTLDLLNDFKHPYLPSTRFEYDESLARNRSSLKKAPGLPSVEGTKRDELSNAIQYVNEVLKPANNLEKAYSILPGARTQQSPLEDPKVRLVWMVPVSIWYMECEAVDDALSRTQESINENLDVFVFYTPPETMAKWVRTHFSQAVQWVNFDATNFDSTVAASEMRQMADFFFSDYEYVDFT
jgi:hypothetical protein